MPSEFIIPDEEETPGNPDDEEESKDN